MTSVIDRLQEQYLTRAAEAEEAFRAAVRKAVLSPGQQTDEEVAEVIREAGRTTPDFIVACRILDSRLRGQQLLRERDVKQLALESFDLQTEFLRQQLQMARLGVIALNIDAAEARLDARPMERMRLHLEVVDLNCEGNALLYCPLTLQFEWNGKTIRYLHPNHSQASDERLRALTSHKEEQHAIWQRSRNELHALGFATISLSGTLTPRGFTEARTRIADLQVTVEHMEADAKLRPLSPAQTIALDKVRAEIEAVQENLAKATALLDAIESARVEEQRIAAEMQRITQQVQSDPFEMDYPRLDQ